MLRSKKSTMLAYLPVSSFLAFSRPAFFSVFVSLPPAWDNDVHSGSAAPLPPQWSKLTLLKLAAQAAVICARCFSHSEPKPNWELCCAVLRELNI